MIERPLGGTICGMALHVHVGVVSRYSPEDTVARLAKERREAVWIRRMEIERFAHIVGRPPAMHVVVARYESDLAARACGPDIG